MNIITPKYRGDRLKIITQLKKRTDIWYFVLLEENVLFKESLPSIMVTRNPNWSIEILWYGIGYAKEKMLSPPKRPTWGRLHCWFSLKLLKNLFFFFLFLFFLSCSWLWRQWTIPTNIFNSGVGKYRTNPKITILLTLASVNIFTKNKFEEEIFYVIFFLFIL
jgi:hypothetical protein